MTVLLREGANTDTNSMLDKLFSIDSWFVEAFSRNRKTCRLFPISSYAPVLSALPTLFHCSPLRFCSRYNEPTAKVTNFRNSRSDLVFTFLYSDMLIYDLYVSNFGRNSQKQIHHSGTLFFILLVEYFLYCTALKYVLLYSLLNKIEIFTSLLAIF